MREFTGQIELEDIKEDTFINQKYITNRTIGWEVKEIDNVEEILKQKGNEYGLYVKRLNIEEIKQDIYNRVLEETNYFKENNIGYEYFHFQSRLIDKVSTALTQEIFRVVVGKKITVDFVKPSVEEVIETCLSIHRLILNDSGFIQAYNRRNLNNK
jgi:hypothetical protein